MFKRSKSALIGMLAVAIMLAGAAGLALKAPDAIQASGSDGLSISALAGAVELTWPTSDASDIEGYVVLRTDGDGRSEIAEVDHHPWVDELSHWDRDVDSDEDYRYEVVEIRSDMAGSGSPTTSEGNTPLPPDDLALSADHNGRNFTITLGWTLQNHHDVDTTKYQIQRSMRNSASADWNWANGSITSHDPTNSDHQSSGWFEFADSDLPTGNHGGKTVTYRISRIHGSDEGADSNPVSIKLPTLRPQNVTAELNGNNVDVSWDAPSSPNVNGYTVYRKVRGNQNPWSEVGTTEANSTSFADSSAPSGETYRYRVVANHEEGDSRKSGYADVSIPAAAD